MTTVEKDLHSDDLKLIWNVHPISESPGRAIIFFLVLGIVIWAVYWNIAVALPNPQSIVFTLFISIILIGSLTSFYLPTEFRIDREGVTIKRSLFTRRLSWKRLKSIAEEKTGLFLSPFPYRTRLENYRGLYLYFRGNREEILELVQHYKPSLLNEGSRVERDINEEKIAE